MGCSPESVENPVASRPLDRRRRQSRPDPRPTPQKNTHVHPLKDASHALRMEQPRPLKGTKVQTLVNLEGLNLLSPPEPRIDLTGPGCETGRRIERPHDVCSCDNVVRCYGAAFIFRKPLSGSRITVPSSRAYWTTS